MRAGDKRSVPALGLLIGLNTLIMVAGTCPRTRALSRSRSRRRAPPARARAPASLPRHHHRPLCAPARPLATPAGVWDAITGQNKKAA